MTSISEYQLLEPITRGSLEVFVAEERRTGLRRLVYLTSLEDASPQPSTRDILKRVRELGPEPVGVIVDAGTDPVEACIYLVTSFPSDPLAVQTWVREYYAFSTGKSGQSPAASAPALTRDVTTSQSSASSTESGARSTAAGGQPTRSGVIGASDSAGTIGKAEATPQVDPTMPIADAGAASVANASWQTTPEDASRQGSVSDLHKPEPSSTLRITGSVTEQRFSGPGSPPPTAQECLDHKTGEFTKFFRGNSSQAPDHAGLSAIDHAPMPANQGPGEFTRMFGSESQSGPRADTPEVRDAVTPNFNNPSPSRNTDLFSSSSEAALVSSEPVKEKPAWGGDFSSPKIDVTPPRIAQTSSVKDTPKPIWEEISQTGGVSQLFPSTAKQRVADQPATAAGPSEFTQIISGGLHEAPSTVAENISSFSTPAPVVLSQAPAPLAAAVPQVPVVPQPSPQPVASQAPAGFQLPVPQAIPQPAAPAKPTLPQAPPRKMASYLPMIIILNVLLITAIAIVLYFLLKPR